MNGETIGSPDFEEGAQDETRQETVNPAETIQTLREGRRESIEGLVRREYGRAIVRTVRTNQNLLGMPVEPVFRDVLTGYMLPEPEAEELSTLVIIGVDPNDPGIIYRQRVKIPPDASPDEREAIEASYRAAYDPASLPLRITPFSNGDSPTVRNVIDLFGDGNEYTSVTHRSDRPEDVPALSESILRTVESLKEKTSSNSKYSSAIYFCRSSSPSSWTK